MKQLRLFFVLCVMLLASSFLVQSANAMVSCCDTPGDANDDGEPNVGDAVYLINYVFKGGPAPVCMEEGDANSDGALDLSDAVTVLTYLFSGQPLACRDAADANDDGEINIADAVYLLGYLFSGGTPPPAPFPACGFENTPDTLDCTGESGC